MKIFKIMISLICLILFGVYLNNFKLQGEKIMNPIEEKLNSMSIEEKIGQMIMIGIHGTEMDDEIIFLLNKFRFGGVIFFDRNLLSKPQTIDFINQIKKTAGQKTPLFLAIDEEGGQVSRGRNFLEAAPSQRIVGASGDPDLANFWAKHNANILRDICININFAPVADIGGQDDRSFSDDPDQVANFVEASARGYEEENFLYCLKHFPGIGKGEIDSHEEISTIDSDKEILWNEDLVPFKKIICEHDNSKFMIMISHLKYSAFDAENPASISRNIITDVLRKNLNFSGVVITDDLEMGAIKNNFDLQDIGMKMILAGGDIALICQNYESQQIVYTSILEAVKRNEIPEERINESVRRILNMKAHL